MDRALDFEGHLAQLGFRADDSVRHGDSARIIEALTQVSSRCVDEEVDPNDRLFAWASGLVDRVENASAVALHKAGFAALTRSPLPVAAAAFLASARLELNDSRHGPALQDACCAACLYSALDGKAATKAAMTAALLAARSIHALAPRELQTTIQAAKGRFRKAARTRLSELPTGFDDLLAAVLANQIAAAGQCAAVNVVDALVEGLSRVADAHRTSSSVQLHLARGLRNAIVTHGRSGRLSKAEAYFTALQGVRVDGSDDTMQRQLASSIVSIIHYRSLAGKTKGIDELVRMLETLSQRSPDSIELAQMLAHGRQNARHVCQQASSDYDGSVLGLGVLAMIKAQARLDPALKLKDLILGILDYTPGVREMERDRHYRNWSAGVRGLCDFMSISPLFPALDEIAAEGLTATVSALPRYRLNRFQTAPWEAFWNAARVARAQMDEQPEASFVLAAVAALGWATTEPDVLFDVSALHPGWLEIPHALAAAAGRLGNFVDSRELAELASGMVSAAKYIYGDDDEETSGIRKAESLEQYRELSGRLYQQYADAAANLADDLRECCRIEEQNLRPHLGAVLFTLGYVPESLLLAKGSSYVPSRALARRAVQQSLICVAADALIQSVWLEIVRSPLIEWNDHLGVQLAVTRKSSGEFRLSSPFPVIDDDEQETPPAISLLDRVDNPYSPVTAYAYALIEWFRDPRAKTFRQWADLTSRSVERVQDLLGGIETNPFLFVRLNAVARLHDLSGRPRRKAVDISAWEALLHQAFEGIRGFHVHPECPEIIANQFNIAICGYIEQALATRDEHKAGTAPEQLERLRFVELQQSLELNPPLRFGGARPSSDALREMEQTLIQDIRGAYFLLHYPTLPPHYRLYGVQQSPVGKSHEPDLRPARGRREIAELRRELSALCETMMQSTPRYAQERLGHGWSTETLVDTLRSHRVQAQR
jgi:hypothetical protein